MARITFSPLVTAASGKVKDTVFSKWKGRAYIRARVVPANPQSAAQTLVRESLARCVTMWQSFEAQLKSAWGVYASPYSISGYNAWMKLNRADEQAGDPLTTSPVNPDILAVTDLAAASGSGSGEIDLTWTDPGQGAGYYAYIITRKSGSDEWVVQDSGTTLMSAGAYTITGLDAGDAYDVTLASELIADNEFSESDFDDATATA